MFTDIIENRQKKILKLYWVIDCFSVVPAYICACVCVLAHILMHPSVVPAYICACVC